MSKHAVENLILDPRVINRAYSAMVTARVTGSIGATEAHVVNGLSESTTVERINVEGYGKNLVGSVAFRVVGQGNDAVIVATGTPGQYATHVDVDAELDEAVALEDLEVPEPEAEEDYLRGLLHNEDI